MKITLNKNADSVTPRRIMVQSFILCILLENVKIFDVMGASIKPIHVVMILSSLYCIVFEKMYIRDISIGMLFLALPLLPLYRINDLTEWLKSYVIYAIMCVFLATAMRYFIAEIQVNYKKHLKLLLFTIAFTQILGIIQFLRMNLYEDFWLRNIWGKYQFHRNQFGKSYGFYRAYSLFYEPSVFAWITFTAFSILLFSEKEAISNKIRIPLLILDVVAMASSLSAAGFIVMLAIIFLFIFVRTPNLYKRIKGLFFVALALVLLVAFTDILKPLKRIFIELSIPGMSGYERVVTPMLYAKEALHNFPLFGRGLGQEGFVDAVGVIGRYKAVHNSIFGVIVHFGLSSLCLFIPAIVYAVKRIGENPKWVLLLINILGIYVSNGAFCSLDTFMFLVIIVAFGAIKTAKPVERNFRFYVG